MKRMHQSFSTFFIAVLAMSTVLVSSCSKDKGDDDDSKDENVIFKENFDDASKSIWKPGTSGPATKTITGGHFVLTYGGNDAAQFKTWSSTNIFPAGETKQAVEIAQVHVKGHEYDKGGPIFSVVDENYILGFQIGNKEFRVYQKVNATTTNLIQWTASPHIKGALNETNKLKVTLADKKLQYYINDNLVATMEAGPITTLDKVGYGIVKGSSPETTYQVDYVKAIKL